MEKISDLLADMADAILIETENRLGDEMNEIGDLIDEIR